MNVSFHVLGAVGVSVGDDERLPITFTMLRGLLACLLLRPNQFVPLSQLASALWHTPPASASSNLRAYAARLRSTLAAVDPELAARLSHVRGRGYRLSGQPWEFDHVVFRDLSRVGREQLRLADAAAAADSLTRALAMWRGQAGDDVPPDSPVQEQLRTLNDNRVTAEEDLAEARLLLGDYGHLGADLRMHIAQHPLRERAYGLLMRALYLSGNPAAALDVYDELRKALATRLGTDPSPEIQCVYLAVLRHDKAALVTAQLGRS
jgi:DNA-binding SARP family transcriptional activator